MSEIIERIWTVAEYDESEAKRLATDAGVSLLTARLLINRGINTSDEVRRFMSPRMEDLHDPFLLPDMEAGVKRIARALHDGEKILVHGDYDVDGITSAALIIRVLKSLKANVVHRVPHRKRDGYDIKPWTADEAKAEGVTLIITTDCGVTACETIEHASELGIDIVVTDHHEPKAELPSAVAVINPRRADSTYPFPYLAGVGVAFKLAQALVRELGYNESKFQQKFLDLVALGTVGDVMPLVDENRILVKHGLESMPQTGKIGLQTMLRHCKLQGKQLSTFYLSFVLAPRINAVGRMDDSAIALQLFLTGDESESQQLVEMLEQLNVERKVEQARILEQAAGIAAGFDLDQKKILVLAAPGWNSGVVGIVASKIVELFGRPSILLSVDQEKRFCHGSARSIETFNLIEALNQCQDVLAGCGGHPHAAGLSVDLDKLEEFDKKINELARDLIKPEDMIPRITADAEIDPEEITREMAAELAMLEPFGSGNPEPIFISQKVNVVSKRRIGDGSHLKLNLQGNGMRPAECVAFGFGAMDDTVQVGKDVDVCYTIRLNKFNGIESVQMVAKDLRVLSDYDR